DNVDSGSIVDDSSTGVLSGNDVDRHCRRWRRSAGWIFDRNSCWGYWGYDDPRTGGRTDNGASVVELIKIDSFELLWTFERGGARSARRRALLSQRQRGKCGLLGLLQLRHSRRRIWNAGHGPRRIDDYCFPRVIGDDDSPIPGRDLECAVL